MLRQRIPKTPGTAQVTDVYLVIEANSPGSLRLYAGKLPESSSAFVDLIVALTRGDKWADSASALLTKPVVVAPGENVDMRIGELAGDSATHQSSVTLRRYVSNHTSFCWITFRGPSSAIVEAYVSPSQADTFVHALKAGIAQQREYNKLGAH